MSNQRVMPTRFAAAVARLDGDANLLREMAAITSEDLPMVLAELEDAFAHSDGARAAAAIHRIKGMLSTFESEGVTIELQEMLDLARAGKLAEARSMYVEYRSEIDRLIQQIASLADPSS